MALKHDHFLEHWTENRNRVVGVGVGKKSTIEKQHYILILFRS